MSEQVNPYSESYILDSTEREDQLKRPSPGPIHIVDYSFDFVRYSKRSNLDERGFQLATAEEIILLEL